MPSLLFWVQLSAAQGTPEMLYQLYGLVIDSDNLFPQETSIGNREVDVQVRQISSCKPYLSPPNWFMNWTLPGGEKWLSCAKTDEGYLLRFNELADFTIDRIGSEIACMPRPGIPEDTIQHLLLDQVIPLVINLRGGEALHASAILTSHGVVAFAGPAGSGKSTITGSLMKMGYPFVSDDCLTLQEKDQTIFSIPAYPGLRLWDDAQEHLFGEKGNKKSVAHYTSKLRVDIEEGAESYSSEPKPFVRLYDIVNSSETDETSDIVIERLSPRDSFMALVRCAFRLDITDQNMLTRQFHFLKKVTSSISVFRLSFPRNFRFLPDVQKAILNDLKELGE
jgi:hypothetical protein